MLFRRKQETQTTQAPWNLLKLIYNDAEKPVVSKFPDLAPCSLNPTASTSYSSMNILFLMFYSKNLEKHMIYAFIVKGPPSLIQNKGQYDNA